MTIRFFALAALFEILPFSAMALPTYTLDQAISTASQSSPALQKAEAQQSEMHWKRVEGFSTFLPALSVVGSHDLIYRFQEITFPTSTFTLLAPLSAGTLQAKWLLFDGLANVDRFRSTSYLSRAADANYNWTRFQLEEEVTLAFEHEVAAKKLANVADENLKTIQNHLDQVKALKGGGVATTYDVLRVEAQLSEAQAEYLQSQDNIQLMQERLGQVLGNPEPADTANGELETPRPELIRKLEFRSQTHHRLDLESLQDQVYASDLGQSANNRYWIPKVSLAGDYTMYNNQTEAINDWQKYRASWTLGLYVSWDIFAPASFAQAKQETYKSIQNQKSLNQANLQAPVDFAFWKKRYLYSATLYIAKKADLERATETVRLANAGFKAGVRTTTDVIDAELDLFRARAGVVTSQMDCVEAKSKLELALGEKISETTGEKL